MKKTTAFVLLILNSSFSLQANDSFPLELERIDIGGIHTQRYNREGDAVSGSSNLGYLDLQGAYIHNKDNENAVSIYPQLSLYESGEGDATSVEVGMYYPIWNNYTIKSLLDQNVDLHNIKELTETDKKRDGRYDFDFPPPLALEFTPGYLNYNQPDGQFDISGMHLRLAAHFHHWFREPTETNRSFFDFSVSLGVDKLLSDDVLYDGLESFIGLNARWSPTIKRNLEFSYNGYFSNIDLEDDQLSRQTAILHELRMEYLVAKPVIFGEDKTGIFVALSYGINRLDNSGGIAGNDISFNYFSPGIYFRYPVENKKAMNRDDEPSVKNFPIGGFWQTPIGRRCYANPACRRYYGG